jgi:transcriptional regulator with XRE-family HTH domain
MKISQKLETLPQELVDLRIKLGISQSQLAKELGIFRSQMSRYESSSFEGASLKKLIRIAKMLERMKNEQ